MKIRLWLFPLLGIYLFLVSATSVEKIQKPMGEIQVAASVPVSATTVQTQKLNIFQRILNKLLMRKDKADVTKAGNLASTSLGLGIAACAAILLGFAVPYIFFASIPLGIAAMITGGSAVRQGTTKVGKAKTGKGLGLGALITMGVLLIMATILITSIDWN